MARAPLGRDIAEQVQAILVFRGQFVEVGAVVAEALRGAEAGAQQGGVEGPVERFDMGIAPLPVIVVQALAAQAQVLAGVVGEAGVVDPEFAQGQVVLVPLAAIGLGVAGQLGVGRLQGVGLDNVAGDHRLAHGEGAPGAALAVEPGAQVDSDTVDVATVAGAEVAVIFRLRGDLDVEAEVVVARLRRPGRAGGE
ncbi:hypothetical protein D3C84_202630 [compost metagenome]